MPTIPVPATPTDGAETFTVAAGKTSVVVIRIFPSEKNQNSYTLILAKAVPKRSAKILF
jgi:hypothetical protein